MEFIFNIVDIWLNIIPHVDYRTFHIIKRLNKTIYRDCFIKKKQLIEDLQNWEFIIRSDSIQNKPVKYTSEWKQVTHKKRINKISQIDSQFIKRVKELDYECFRNFMTTYLPNGYDNNNLKYCLSMLIPGDTVNITINDINHKHPYKFYYDGICFVKMIRLIDYGKYCSIYNRKMDDWEEYREYLRRCVKYRWL
jgi:hypothetical protein